MIEWERRMRVKDLMDQGMSERAIAKQLGISRKTIYRWKKAGLLEREIVEVPRYGPRPRVAQKLDAYKAYIRERLEAFPKLSAVRLYEEVKGNGYTGGYSRGKEYVRRVRPVPAPEPVIRFETPAGKQAQVDFADFRLPWGKRYALLVVLGYSRLLWVKFYTRKTMRVLMGGLEEAFGFFGGVPDELLFDQLKAVVIDDEREDGGRVLYNREFLRFAAHWEVRVRACRPYRAQTKGKVERPVSYLRDNFFYARTFANDADLNEQARAWLEGVANVRIHGTLKEQPVARFERERGSLGPLALSPYRSLVLGPEQAGVHSKAVAVPVQVERRPLAHYAHLAGGGVR